MTPGKVFDRFVVVVVLVLALLLLHNNQHHLVFFFFFFFFLCCFFLLLVICLTSMSFGFFDIAEIWKAQRDSRHLLLLLLLLCWALSCYFKVLSWRLSFSCYRQSVVVVENFFLSCGLPSKCVVVVENEFLSLLWVTYLPMICFQRFQLSSI